ncbi:hypothetical protein GDO78_000589 [Eleutherodactylus coqui]|uniref:Uncharacterized protein n=1 Tax=Eleutherodactylus coqui TaxID=57060 RepID=A0A8J6FQT2_ELECQ|nr:hypothetical protein GDO78_000589 [Eleutherodactylus coqui]
MLGPDACAMVKPICDMEEMLLDMLKNTEFVMLIDESTVRDNEALLLAYVCFINQNEEVVEELFTRNLTNTKGSSMHKRVEEFFQEKHSSNKYTCLCS